MRPDATSQQLSHKQYKKELLRLQTELVYLRAPTRPRRSSLPPRQRRKYKRLPKQSEREVPVRYMVR
jgi:hypothetical protein